MEIESEKDNFLNFTMLDLILKNDTFELVYSEKEFNFLHKVFNLENKNTKYRFSISNSEKQSLHSRLSESKILENEEIEKTLLFQIKYTFFYEKIPLITEIIINFLDNCKYRKNNNGGGEFPKIIYFSNNNDFSFDNLLDILQQFLINKYDLQKGVNIYEMIKDNFILLKSFSAIDFVLNLMYVKKLIKKDYLIKLIIVDTINDFFLKKKNLLLLEIN